MTEVGRPLWICLRMSSLLARIAKAIWNTSRHFFMKYGGIKENGLPLDNSNLSLNKTARPKVEEASHTDCP